MSEGEGWQDRAGPWARATLPDGQALDLVVISRSRTRDGRWWYTCEAVLTGRYETAEGRTVPVGVPTELLVPAEDIAPIPGEDYSAVPTEGAVTGRQWLLQRLHRHADGRWGRLHRRDCWQARGGEELVTTTRARDLLGAAGVESCEVCRPATGLRD